MDILPILFKVGLTWENLAESDEMTDVKLEEQLVSFLFTFLFFIVLTVFILGSEINI